VFFWGGSDIEEDDRGFCLFYFYFFESGQLYGGIALPYIFQHTDFLFTDAVADSNP
jgi:hypothetical protein